MEILEDYERAKNDPDYFQEKYVRIKHEINLQIGGIYNLYHVDFPARIYILRYDGKLVTGYNCEGGLNKNDVWHIDIELFILLNPILKDKL